MNAWEDRDLELLGAIRAWGRKLHDDAEPEPDDDTLLAKARGIDALVVPEDISGEQWQGLLSRLRASFDDGFWPTRIRLDEVIRHLRAMGHHAFVEQTGGNTATLYAGTAVTDAAGDRRWSVAVGPCWFTNPEWTAAMADTSDLAIGPDDNGDSPPRMAAEGMSAHQVAMRAAECIKQVDAKRVELARARERLGPVEVTP